MMISSVLKEMNELHLQLLELAQQKRVALLNNSITDLQRITEQEEQLVGHIANHFSELSTGGVEKVNELIVPLEEPERGLSNEALNELLGSVEKLKLVNNENQQLVQQSLYFVQRTLDIAVPTGNDYNYAPNQPASSSQGAYRTFDSKA
ncbi:flagellar protein FlgN [Aureibacillus halotolerans]|uniref:FlgN protein n=1 Tax=Aureibacillus halotolerans TaxID=1508390 RepID=A0A4R6TTD5_9BACI|nr:flagellar protein FlgN [Aureibacillus halotolerans]TDQ36928.1 FlgN protein [Aureibacillus halotolerans]